MKKSSIELNQKAAGYMLAAANAVKRETKQNNEKINRCIKVSETSKKTQSKIKK
jgi:hypothetical protein